MMIRTNDRDTSKGEMYAVGPARKCRGQDLYLKNKKSACIKFFRDL